MTKEEIAKAKEENVKKQQYINNPNKLVKK
jgi:hypothetical protein